MTLPTPMKRHNARLMRDFGRRLRAARLATGYVDAADFAADLGVQPPRYRKYERGESMPPPALLDAIVHMTGQSLDWLILGNSPHTTRKEPPLI